MYERLTDTKNPRRASIEIELHATLDKRTGKKHGQDSINLLLFLQKQNLAIAIYLFGLGTLLTHSTVFFVNHASL